MKRSKLIASGMILLLTLSQFCSVVYAENETAGSAENETVGYVSEDESVTSIPEEVIDVMPASSAGSASDKDVIVDWQLDDYTSELTYGYVDDEEFEAPFLTPRNDGIDFQSDDSYFNGYEEGYMPEEVRNQRREGACWAFASIGAVEINLIKNHGVDKTIDLSETHLVYFNLFSVDDPKDCHDGDKVEYVGNRYLNTGGNAAMAYHTMLNLIGPVEETVTEYMYDSSYMVDAALAYGNSYAQVKNVYAINPDDREGIKSAVKQFGSVVCSMHATPGDYTVTANGVTSTASVKYNTKTNAFYGTVKDTNHGVLIVGWDDEFSKENFTEGCQPPADGAWLIRNSWGGQGYELDGYFWLSYYDASLVTSRSAYAYDVSLEVNDNVYAYDGNPVNHMYTTSKNIYGAQQQYWVDDGEIIKAVSFETYSTNLTAIATVTCGGASITKSIDTTFAGYYSIEFDTALLVDERSLVTVSIDYYSDTDSDISIVLEGIHDKKELSNTGIYYIGAHEAIGSKVHYKSSSGSDYWIDYEYDICMKLYTDNADESLLTKTVDVAGFDLSVDGSVGVNAYIQPRHFRDEVIESYYVTATYGDVTERIDLNQKAVVDIADKSVNCYVIPIRLAAKDMGTDVIFRLYDSDDNPIELNNSNMDDGYGYVYSVNRYLKCLQSGEDEAAATLAQAMAAYGQIAACYFGIDDYDCFEEKLGAVIGDESAGEICEDVKWIDADVLGNYSKVSVGSVEGLTYLGSSLLLTSGTGIRHYFVLEDDYDFDRYSFKVGVQSVTPTVTGNVICIDVESNVTAVDYAREYKLVIDDNGGTGSYIMYYSVYSYLYDAMIKAIDTDDAVLRDLAGYMYLYGQNAAAYYRD
ncbi:MAG: C1 family peptidase [Lachnospiraceae bacterium]|nr:C1 family peptidase [Lachnospiraceae bacterium]